MLVGDTDVTAMLTVDAANVSYTPQLPLPAGESDVTVWLVSPGNQWKELARFPLRVAATPWRELRLGTPGAAPRQ